MFCRVPHGQLTAKKWLDSIEKRRRIDFKEQRDGQTSGHWDRQSQLLTEWLLARRGDQKSIYEKSDAVLTSWMQCSKLPEPLCQIQRRSSIATLATWLAVRQTDVTVAEWAVSLCRQQPASRSHRRTLLSSEPLAASLPHYIGSLC